MEEREIAVIDTSGLIVKESRRMQMYRREFLMELETLKGLAKIFVYAPGGLNAILLVTKFGSRSIRDDLEALQLLFKFLTAEAQNYMILVLTHGDKAEYNASQEGIAVEEYLINWINRLDDWMKKFIHDDLKDRVVLFNCRLKPDQEPEAYKKQLCKLIEVNC